MGYSDIGCYGSEIETPNLDRIADQGTRLTQMYTSPRCCPSRAALLTGVFPTQAGVGHFASPLDLPGYEGRLNDKTVTIAEVLKGGGYQTAMVGKWHVASPMPGEPGPGHPRPLDRGFERFYGTLAGAGSYYNPRLLFDGEAAIQASGDFYYTDAITARSVSMIDEFAEAGRPFFLHVAYTAPHWPLHALPEDIDKYRGSYLRGWNVSRAERMERMEALGIVDSKWPLSKPDASLPPEPVTREERTWLDACMATYAAQIAGLDRGVGRIVQAIRRNGIEGETLLVFLSDNGACAEVLGKGTRTGSGLVNGEPVTTGLASDVMPGPRNTYRSYGPCWANLSNTPFRLYKHWVHEGGISTPFLAWWPGVIPAGSVRHQPCHIVDVMATFLECTGLKYPSEFDGKRIVPLEGRSLWPLLAGRDWDRGEPLAWEHEGNMALRVDDLKIVCRDGRPWELYDMESCRTEVCDIAADYPHELNRLKRLYGDWARRTGVLPWKDVFARRTATGYKPDPEHMGRLF